MEKDSKITIINENGEEELMTILFTCEVEDMSLVYFYNDDMNDGEELNVMVMRYDNDGHLFELTPEQIEIAEEILEQFYQEEINGEQQEED